MVSLCPSGTKAASGVGCDVATTSIWSVKGWLGKVVIYVENPDKTRSPEIAKLPELSGMEEKETQGLPDIRWHDLRSTFCTILLKNNFNPKAVSQLMGHAKEIITIDVYGDTAEIIEDCLDDLQPFIDEVIPKEESENGTDFSEDNYIEQIREFLA